MGQNLTEVSGTYAHHFLLDARSVCAYAKDVVHYFDVNDELECMEIGDGNINYVFKIVSNTSGKSLIIKQADTVLRSSGRALDMTRNKREAEMLRIERALAPQYVPEVYHYDERMCAIAMEDISSYKNLRTELISAKEFPLLAGDIVSFLVETLLPLTDLVLESDQKKERVKYFVNPELCAISEDLVFTEPYTDYKKRNIITCGNARFVEQALYRDGTLHSCVAALRNSFMNNAQSLLHGDLHSGSIFVNEHGMKVIDPEFAFYGPIGYDVGNVIGNLFFAYALFYATAITAPCDAHFFIWLTETIAELFDSFETKFKKKYDELVHFPLYKTTVFKNAYVQGVLADAVGYAGTEMIRRVVGDAKVRELTSVTDMQIKIPLERALIMLGKTFIKERKALTHGADLTQAAQDIFAFMLQGC